MSMASKAKTTYSYDRVSHKSWLLPYWFTYALCVGDLSKAASGMPIICSKNKKAIVCGKQNTGLKMREELIVRFLSSGLAQEQKHTDTSHCCWQPVQVHSLLSWSWQRERNAGGNAEMLAMLKPTLSNLSYLPGNLLCTNETVISHFSAFKRETFLSPYSW